MQWASECLFSLVASKNSLVLDLLSFLPWGWIGHIFLANLVSALCKMEPLLIGGVHRFLDCKLSAPQDGRRFHQNEP
jgi:hypothetical protein